MNLYNLLFLTLFFIGCTVIVMNKENIIINIDNNARHAEAKANTYLLRNMILTGNDFYYAYVNGYLEENDIGGEGERI